MVKFLKLLSNIFTKNKENSNKYSFKKEIDDEIFFNDLNSTRVKIKVKTINNENILFITNNEDTFMFVFDKDLVTILTAILNDFNKNGTLQNIKKLIGEIK